MNRSLKALIPLSFASGVEVADLAVVPPDDIGHLHQDDPQHHGV
jgi:hypothetical protein